MKNKLFAVLSVCGALCASQAFGEAVDTTVVATKGEVEYAKPNSTTFEPLNKGTVLKVGSKIKTGADGSVTLSPFPGAAAQVGANSVMTITDADLVKKGEKLISRKALLDISDGSVIAVIDKNARGKTDFRLRSPKVVAAAKGTSYSLSKSGNSWVVVVKEGPVVIQLPNGTQRTVNANEKITIFPDGTASNVSGASATELAAVQTVQDAAQTLNLVQGTVSEGNGTVGTSGNVNANLIVTNPANISGDVNSNEQ